MPKHNQLLNSEYDVKGVMNEELPLGDSYIMTQSIQVKLARAIQKPL